MNTTSGTTEAVLKWVAGIMAVIIASGVIWKATTVEGDLRSFAMDIRELKTTIVLQKESFNSLAYQVNEMQRILRDRQVASR